MTPIEFAFILGYLCHVTEVRRANLLRKHKERSVSRDKDNTFLLRSSTKKDIPRHVTESFEPFWLAYPKRKGPNPKKPALLVFARVVKEGADPAVLTAAVKNYAAAEKDNIGTPYIPQATKWLNQEYWHEYIGPAAEIISKEEFARLKVEHERREEERAAEREVARKRERGLL